MHGLIQQDDTRRNRHAREVACKRWMIGRDVDGHHRDQACSEEWSGESSVRNSSANAACGSLPVALRGKWSTLYNGRGRNADSIFCFRLVMMSAVCRFGATTNAASRTTSPAV